MFRLKSMMCWLMLLSLIPLGSAWAKKPKGDEGIVSGIALDVVRVEACARGKRCVTASGPIQLDLLDLADGKVDFANQVLLPAKTKELRLVLGDNNTITVNNEEFPLTVPSGQTSGLKLKGRKAFPREGGLLSSLTLNLNLKKQLVVRAKRSKSKGKGKKREISYVYSYKLKPVIKVATAEVAPMTDEVAAVVAMPDEESEIKIGETFSLVIPAGAVSEPMVISVEETKYTVEVLDEETGEVVEKPALSSNYELSPDGAEFNEPLVITIPYDPETLPSDVSEYDLAVYLDGERIPTDINTMSKTATADVWHFTDAIVDREGRQTFETQMPIDNRFQPNNIGYKFMTYHEACYGATCENIYHPAADINAANDINENVPFFAIADGTVIANSTSWGGIVIEHVLPDGKIYYSQYGHMNHLTKEEDEVLQPDMGVKKGDKIGYIGKVGGSSGMTPHLHFEIRSNFHTGADYADFYCPKLDGCDVLTTRKEVFEYYESPLAFVRSYENPCKTVIIVEDSVTYPGIGEDDDDNRIKDNKVISPDGGVVIKERFFKPYPSSFFGPRDPRYNLPEWSTGSGGELSGFGGNYHYAPTVSGETPTYAGTWYFDIPETGLYMIDASVPANHATTEKAKYRIYHNKRYDNVTINQAIVSGPLDDRWVRLGVFDFVEGNDHYVKLRNNTGETNKEVGFDALKLVKVSDAAVTSVSPATAKLNELTTFTVSGQSLPSNLLFWLDGCLDVERLDSTSTFMQFRCTPSSSGIKSGMIRFRPYSVVLNEFTVDVKHAPEVPEVTSVSPAAAILGDPTDFTIMGKNLPSTLSFQLEGCVDIESIGHKSSTYMQFRCTPVSTGEKDGILRDRPSGTILHSFKVTVGNAPPNEELVLKAVRVDLSEKDNSAATCSYISAEDLKTEDEERCSVASGGTIHEGERVTYKATAYFAKNVGTGDVNHVAGEYVEDCNGEDVTNECTWMATPTMYVTSYGNGEIEALPGSAGQTVKMKCLYYHSPSNIQIVGTLPITINP